jgi:hypothetical protein
LPNVGRQTDEAPGQSILAYGSQQTHRPPWDVVVWEEKEGIRIQGVSDDGNRLIRRLKARNFGRITSTVELHTMMLNDDETEAIMEEIDATGLRTRTL